VSNRFLSLATTNAPDARHGHAAVACTFEMIVWGGYSAASSTVVNSGSRYDPLSDTWTAMSTTDAPSARMDHSAVWTGEKMLVWGGSSTTLENSGASYDPVADKWTPLSVTNAPTARKHHTAVFSSPYMIVWGGLGSDATGVVKLDSGGLYKVTDDTWTAINTVGAPIARFNHRAIVDKTKMVLWGGQGSEPLADGGIYDLTTNAWTLISAETKVKGRTLHSLVFTGTHLIVWGGFSSAGKYMDSGYAYKWP
jgi:N-acetylneuraminic acid mutarotase